MLPGASRQLLAALEVIIFLGLDHVGVPLQCVGWGGYLAKLVFFLLAPLVLVALTNAYFIGWHLVQHRFARDAYLEARGETHEMRVLKTSATRGLVRRGLLDALPLTLRALFFACPLIFTVAFEAYSCEDFDLDDTDGFCTGVGQRQC